MQLNAHFDCFIVPFQRLTVVGEQAALLLFADHTHEIPQTEYDMTLRGLLLTVSLGAGVLLTGCGSQGDGEATGASTTAADDDAAATASRAPAQAAGGAAGAVLPLTGQAFVETVSASDTFELESARIVQSAGVTGPTREFAQMMIKAHGASTRDLGAAANRVDNIELEKQPTLTDEQKAQLAELHASGPDRVAAVYARQQVAAHEKALAVLQTYAQSGDAQPLMDFARAASGVVSKHLEQARRLP